MEKCSKSRLGSKYNECGNLWTIYVYHHQSVLPNGRSFTANAGSKVSVLSKGRSSPANSGSKVVDLLGINRCDSFPLFSTHHSLFSISTDLKRSEKIPGTSTWRWGEWFWLIGPIGLHRNSPQGLNISSIRVLTISEIRKFQSHFPSYCEFNICSCFSRKTKLKIKNIYWQSLCPYILIDCTLKCSKILWSTIH